jgi:uncharacterized damage-inducible protein DinB
VKPFLGRMAGMPQEEPHPGLPNEAAHHAAFLAFLRSTVVEKCRSLTKEAQRSSQLPSGWTPLELLVHLLHVERRWFVWGFLGEEVESPWGDSGDDPDARWQVPDALTLEDVVAQLETVAARTEAVLRTHDLEDVSAVTGRFAGTTPPDLRWICFHVLQEYARHAGHLDVAVELASGRTGE